MASAVTLLASYTYDMAGVPVSVQVGSSTSAPRYYYVYDARGDVVNLTDSNGNVVASYAYDTWGNLTSASENIPNANGWVNPFRFDGRDSVRYDASTGLDWMSVRAYDPSVGRFLSRDPLGRAPLFFADNPYVYAGNNPLSNVDPSGQYRAAGFGSKAHESWKATKKMMARVVSYRGTPASSSSAGSCGGCQIKTVQTTPPPAYDGYGCQVGDHACDAQQLAANITERLGGIGVIMGVATLVLAGLTLSAVIPFNPLMPFLPLLAALTTAVGVATSAAALLAVDFGREAGEPSGWFTSSNFADFSRQINAQIAAFLGAITFITATFLMAGPLSTAVGFGFGAGLIGAGLLAEMALANLGEQDAVLFNGA